MRFTFNQALLANNDLEIPTEEFEKMQKSQDFVFIFIYIHLLFLAQKLDSVKLIKVY